MHRHENDSQLGRTVNPPLTPRQQQALQALTVMAKARIFGSRFSWKVCWLLLLSVGSLLLAGMAPAALQAQPSPVLQAVDRTTRYLILNWRGDPLLKKMPPPQVLPLSAGSKVYGACGEAMQGHEVAGSSYCGTTHSIYLVPEQLQAFNQAFGPSAVAYVVAHEFGHAIQTAFRVTLRGRSRELQADCLAGLVIRSGSRELEISRENVLAMAQAAYAIGSDTHGSGTQRAYALLAGMGVVNASCESAVMESLAGGRIQDPVLRQLSQQRSGGSRPDIEKTPYPKTLQSALGI